jgi:hypothetical protein
LSDRRIVEKVTRNFVPLCASRYKICVRKDAAGDFWRSVTEQKQQHQGIWIVGTDGKVLSAYHDIKDIKNWSNEVLATIDAALDKAGPLTARKVEKKDVMPYWGKGAEEDGSITLACHVRQMSEGKGGRIGALDGAHFSAKDFKEFAPPEPVRGKSWYVPGRIATDFGRCLSVFSDKSLMPGPDDVTEVEIAGTVERVKNGVATLSYRGRIAALHVHTYNRSYETASRARIVGTATYDVERKEMLGLLWIFEGGYHNVRPPEKGDNPFAAVVEWKREAR